MRWEAKISIRLIINLKFRDVFRRRLEPLMEEEFSDSESEDNKQTPTNSDDQVNT